jgi:hypothetical protein
VTAVVVAGFAPRAARRGLVGWLRRPELGSDCRRPLPDRARGVLSELPAMSNKVRVAIKCSLDLLFAREIEQTDDASGS